MSINDLLEHLTVHLDAFAMCEVDETAALQCDPFDQVVLHFITQGSGMLHCAGQKYALRQGTVVIVPSGLQKLITGDGPIETIVNAKDLCVLSDGLLKFRAGSGEPGLVIGCATLDASLDGISDVFEHLWEPMVEDAVGASVGPLFDLIQEELSDSKLGARAIVGTAMKQILIEVFRGQLARESYRMWLWPAMMQPQLAKAAFAMMSQPQKTFSVDSLAQIAGMSRSRFTELFGRTFGRSPIEFLQIVRLRMGRRLLRTSSLPVKTVAAAVGYSSRSHFSRAYQAYYGEAPSAPRPSDA